MVAVRTFTRTDAGPAMMCASWTAGIASQRVQGRLVAHPGARVEQDEGQYAATERGRVDVDRRPPDHAGRLQLAHPLVRRARRQADGLPECGVRLPGVVLQGGEELAIQIIYGHLCTLPNLILFRATITGYGSGYDHHSHTHARRGSGPSW